MLPKRPSSAQRCPPRVSGRPVPKQRLLQVQGSDRPRHHGKKADCPSPAPPGRLAETIRTAQGRPSERAYGPLIARKGHSRNVPGRSRSAACPYAAQRRFRAGRKRASTAPAANSWSASGLGVSETWKAPLTTEVETTKDGLPRPLVDVSCGRSGRLLLLLRQLQQFLEIVP